MFSQKIIFQIVLLLFVFSSKLTGQTSHTTHNHHHDGFNNELGISVGIVQIENDEDMNINTHIHLMRHLRYDNFLKRVALGMGIETIFAEELHVSILGTFSYNLVSSLFIDLAPGLLIASHDGHQQKEFIAHIELIYEFDIGLFGLGPVVGMALSEDDRHYSLGIHLGRGF